MRAIFSKAKPGLLLHQIIERSDIMPERKNVSPDAEFLQVGVLKPPAGTSYRAHYHKACTKTATVTQEGWVLISGMVRASYYDIDNALLEEEIIYPGGASITYHGGHAYEVLREAEVFEFKLGPYLGQEADKEFIAG